MDLDTKCASSIFKFKVFDAFSSVQQTDSQLLQKIN